MTTAGDDSDFSSAVRSYISKKDMLISHTFKKQQCWRPAELTESLPLAMDHRPLNSDMNHIIWPILNGLYSMWLQ